MTRQRLRVCSHRQQSVEVAGDGRLIRHWLVAWTGRGTRLQRRRCPYRGTGRAHPGERR
jgi:hypothetical protein